MNNCIKMYCKHRLQIDLYMIYITYFLTASLQRARGALKDPKALLCANAKPGRCLCACSK